MIYLNEKYGPVFQGEGPSMGRHCMFVRLAGCPLHCWFCDSAYTWRYSSHHDHVGEVVYNKAQEIHKVEEEELADWLIEAKSPMIVFTGGEPLVQQEAIGKVLEYLKTSYYTPRIEFETAGIISPKEILHTMNSVGWDYHFNVSPKLSSSKNTYEERVHFDVLRLFNLLANDSKAAFKFVVMSPEDIIEIKDFADYFRIKPEHVYLMAEGITAEKIIDGTKNLEVHARKYGWNVTTRLHVLLHGNRRAI